MFKKFLLAILLLAILVSVAWVKVLRQQDRLESSYDEGLREAGRELSLAEQEADSLRMALAEREVAFGEQLTEKESNYRAGLDSLSGVIDTLEEKVGDLKLALTSAEKQARKAAQAKKSSQPTLEQQVVAYYKKRYSNLPKDLSTYEQKVAVREIRQETAEKFKISLSELNRIRSQNNISY